MCLLVYKFGYFFKFGGFMVKVLRFVVKIFLLRSVWVRFFLLIILFWVVLIRIVVGFMILNWGVEIIFFVEGVSGMWIVIILFVVKSLFIFEILWIEVFGMVEC